MRSMAVELFVSKSRVAHVASCIRLQHPTTPPILEVWDGTGTIFPCRSCLFPSQGRRRRPLPCPKCRQRVARPCKHNGIIRVIKRKGRGSQRILVYPDLAIERDWLQSLLDS